MIYWHHIKSGGVYEILEFGLIEASLTPCVIYRLISGGNVWIRPCSEFFDGRFEPIVQEPIDDAPES